MASGQGARAVWTSTGPGARAMTVHIPPDALVAAAAAVAVESASPRRSRPPSNPFTSKVQPGTRRAACSACVPLIGGSNRATSARVESRASAARRRARTRHPRQPLPGHEQVEQDRASPVLVHLDQLARPTVIQVTPKVLRQNHSFVERYHALIFAIRVLPSCCPT